MTELLPCPFCEGEPRLWQDFERLPEKLWYVSCRHCGAMSNSQWEKDIAVSTWNRRAP